MSRFQAFSTASFNDLVDDPRKPVLGEKLNIEVKKEIITQKKPNEHSRAKLDFKANVFLTLFLGPV